MKLILRPPGKGNWSPIVLEFDERHHRNLPVPLDAKPGDLIELAGRAYRVSRVLP